jgi:hypothetical protein
MLWLLCILLAQTTSPAAESATAAAERAAVAAEKAAEAAQKAAEAAQKAAESVAKPAASAVTPAPANPPGSAIPPANAPPPAPPDVVWSGTVGLGLIALTGNSQTITFSTNAALQRKSKDWIWAIKASAAYGQNQAPQTGVSQVTALNGAVSARGDRRLSDQLSIYLLAGIETDHLASVEERPYGELGVSLIWFSDKVGDFEKTSLRTDLGFRYGHEYRFQYYPNQLNEPGVDIVAPRLGVAYRYALNKDVIFTEEISALGNVVDTPRLLFTSTTKISSRLTEKVSLGVSFVVNDDTVPAPGKVPTDTALTVGLEVAL